MNTCEKTIELLFTKPYLARALDQILTNKSKYENEPLSTLMLNVIRSDSMSIDYNSYKKSPHDFFYDITIRHSNDSDQPFWMWFKKNDHYFCVKGSLKIKFSDTDYYSLNPIFHALFGKKFQLIYPTQKMPKEWDVFEIRSGCKNKKEVYENVYRQFMYKNKDFYDYKIFLVKYGYSNQWQSCAIKRRYYEEMKDFLRNVGFTEYAELDDSKIIKE